MEVELFSTQFFIALGSIIVIDLVLAGDNAVIIAMASNRLRPDLRKRAIYLGTAGAIIIRMLMTFVAVELMRVPYLQAVGGMILLPIAIKLLKPAHGGEKVTEADTFMGAIRTIIIADAAMGVDNVLAVAGASHGDFFLVVLGLIISVPIIVGGSQIIGRLLDKYPVLIFVGAGVLGWTAGSMIMHDRIIGTAILESCGTMMNYLVPAGAAIIVTIAGILMRAKKNK